MESTTYKTMELQWVQRQQFRFLCSFMAYTTTTTLSKTVFRPTVWKCYIDDIFSVWDISKPDIEAFIEQANLNHPTIKFTAETFDNENAFLDTVVYKGTRFKDKFILDAKTHFKQTETFLHTHSTSCHLPSVEKGFVKGEALRILRKNSSETTFEENNSNFKKTRDGQTLPTNFDRKPTVRNEIHRKGV